MTISYNQVFDKFDDVRNKVKCLAHWLRHFNGSCVVHVGAGMSTSAGIRDFRGKGGVWTELLKSQEASNSSENRDLKKEGVKVKTSIVKPFDQAEPTASHLILKTMCELGFVKHIISQNVDGLFLKSGINRKFISELHGNFYLDECTKCRSRFIRSTPSPTMRLQKSNVLCPRAGQPCKGRLRDTILDWESSIPFNELRCATKESKRNKLHICIGTSLQLSPSKDLVAKQNNKSTKLVIINLQPTNIDEKADLVINYYADDVMKELANELNLDVPSYDPSQDLTKNPETIGKLWKK